MKQQLSHVHVLIWFVVIKVLITTVGRHRHETDIHLSFKRKPHYDVTDKTICAPGGCLQYRHLHLFFFDTKMIDVFWWIKVYSNMHLWHSVSKQSHCKTNTLASEMQKTLFRILKKKENQSKLSDSSGFYSNAWYQRECLIYSYAAL